MPFDGVVLSAVAAQLSALLCGGRIEKIYQPEPHELLFHLSARKERHKLFLSADSAGPRLHLVRDYGPYPQNPMGFCMLLRKHIQGGRISQIRQKGSERVVEFAIDTVNEMGFSQNRTLLVEIMGKHSNIILTDSRSGRILDSVKRLTPEVNRYRQTLPGCPYVEPPSHGKISWWEAGAEDLRRLLSGCEGADAAAKALLSGVQGLSPRAAEELALEAEEDARARKEDGIPPDSACRALEAMAGRIRAGDFSPRVYVDSEGAPVDFHVFPLRAFEGSCRALPFESASEAVDYFYSNKLSSNRVRQKSADLLKAARNSLDKLLLKKQRLLEDLSRAEDAGRDKLFGELLTASLHTLRPGQESALVANYYDGGQVEIPLDPRLSPAKNAQRYYKLYGKAKRGVVEKGIQLAENDREISYLESVLNLLENASTVEEVDALRLELVESGYLRRRGPTAGKKPARPMPRAYPISGGFQALAGRNNRENDLITFKRASARDLWLHAKDLPGTHVVLLLEGREATEQAIFEAAAIAAWHSRGRASENVPVDCALVKHVKKPSGAKPGMVIFTNNRTVFVKPALPALPSESEG
jgi:predicted ribosome quality control (RQC) complex YloA/Tae2 family protein